MPSHFRVVIFSGADAPHILRLVQRIHREVPEAHVCGILCERRGGKPVSNRAVDFLRNLRQRDFIEYAASKIWDGVCEETAKAGSVLLRFAHGGAPSQVRKLDALKIFKSLHCAFYTTSD